jgi:ABC-type multidrug transport system fused ATPase/permease subunit
LSSSYTKEDRELANQLLHDLELSDVVRAYISPNNEKVLSGPGNSISGGQAQRIGIARALFRNKPITILDEATSAVDQKTESVIITHILESFCNQTLIMVCHRIDALKKFDRIIVLSDGLIVADGSYEYLAYHSEEFRELAQINPK